MSRQAFKLILNNIVTLGVVNIVAEIVMFLSKVCVACACGWLTFWILENEPRYQDGGEDEVSSVWLPVLMTIIFAFAMASGFFYVFDMYE